ncbi:MAG: GumC family protein [Alkalilacustris sp.]
MTFDIKFLLMLFLRRLHILILVAVPVAAGALWYAASLPARFEANAQLLVESPQVPVELAASTLRASPAEVLNTIRQRILARENMLDMSRTFDLHSGAGLSPDAIVADMRQRITITSLGRGASSGTIRVGFESGNPEVAARVANAIVDRILRENVALRTAATTQTLAFFDEEMERLSADLSRQTERMVNFRQVNRDALPDSLNFRRTRQTAQQERLMQIDRDISSLRDRRDRTVATFERTGSLSGGDANATPEQRELAARQRELARAMVIFSPQNPRLRTLRAEVEALESIVAGQLGTDDGPTSLFDLQIADLDAQIEALEVQKATLEEELAELALSIDATPGVASELSAMQRDFDNLQSQYNAAVSRRAQARIGERIEAQARGHRITVLEQAVAPSRPNRPNRTRIAAAGTGGGLALGALIVTLLILSNRTILRPVEVTQGMGMAPFGTVPLFRSRRDILIRRALLGGIALTLLVAVPTLMWWLDRNVMPIDILMARVMDMTGASRVIERLRDALG